MQSNRLPKQSSSLKWLPTCKINTAMNHCGYVLSKLKTLWNMCTGVCFLLLQVFCARCCTQKARLAYDSNRLNRVCDECYIIIRNRDLGEGEWETPEVMNYFPLCPTYSFFNLNLSIFPPIMSRLACSSDNYQCSWFILLEQRQ